MDQHDFRRGYLSTRNGSTFAAKNIARLPTGKLPDCLSRVQRAGNRYKKDLENAVIAKKDGISVVDAHAIDTAAGYEIHAGVLRWLLRERFETMSTKDIRECSRALAEAREKRDKAMRQLGLDVQESNDIIATLYSAETSEKAS